LRVAYRMPAPTTRDASNAFVAYIPRKMLYRGVREL
jgi:hypothetical protein